MRASGQFALEFSAEISPCSGYHAEIPARLAAVPVAAILEYENDRAAWSLTQYRCCNQGLRDDTLRTGHNGNTGTARYFPKSKAS